MTFSEVENFRYRCALMDPSQLFFVEVYLIREALILEAAGLSWIQPVNDPVYDITFDVLGVLE